MGSIQKLVKGIGYIYNRDKKVEGVGVESSKLLIPVSDKNFVRHPI